MAVLVPPVDAASSGPRRLIGGHRTDIEGLRAVAVVAVLLYHAGVPGFDGGYVGVDVFFALSGYLMTALLVTEHQVAGTISFRAFYARRARRLLPASVLVLLATLVAAWYVLPPRAFARAATDTMAAGAYVVNFRFAGAATDYLGSDVDASPVLHYWSLAVEEQFYLVWPILLALALRRSRSFRAPVVLLALVSLGSFVLAVAWTSRIQPWAFFSLPTRAWEFGVGGLAAFVAADAHWLRGRRGQFLGWSGIALVVGAVVGFDHATPFPGPWALVPVVGTVAVLVVGQGRTIGPAQVLSCAPLQWIGRRSYGIYLWHWPPLVLLPVWLGRELRLVESVAVVAGSVVVAGAALRLVEEPIRYATWLSSSAARSGVLALVLTSAAVVVPWTARGAVDLSGSGAARAISRGAIVEPVGPTPVPGDLQPSLDAVGDDKPGDLYEVGCHVGQLGEEPLLPCEYGTVDGGRTIVLFGDSHMAQWFPAFERLGRDRGIRIVSLTKSGCPSVDLQVYNVGYERWYRECDEWRTASFQVIEDLAPDAVVLGNYPSSRTGAPDDSGEGFDERWLSALSSTIASLAASDAQIIVLGPTPLPPYDVPDCVSGELSDSRPCDLVREDVLRADRISAERAVAAGLGAHYLDTSAWFCGPTVCPAVIGPYLVYRDGSHVTTTYMEWLGPSLVEVWDEGRLFEAP